MAAIILLQVDSVQKRMQEYFLEHYHKSVKLVCATAQGVLTGQHNPIMLGFIEHLRIMWDSMRDKDQ